MLLEEYKHKHDETEELNKMQDAKKGQEQKGSYFKH